MRSLAFSVEELCAPKLWFSDDADGSWEWKGPAAQSGRCLYGKIFNKKAGFVSREWVPDFVNFRRDGYDLDARWDEGLTPQKDKELYEAIANEKTILSKRLKETLNYRKGGSTGFETCVTRLQMQGCPLLPPRVHKDTPDTTSDTAIILGTVRLVDVDIG